MKTDRSKKRNGEAVKAVGEETSRGGGLPQYGLVQVLSGEREDGM